VSIYGTWLTIEDARLWAEEMADAGIEAGIINDGGPVDDFEALDPDHLDAPIVYEGSHILPSNEDRRGGSVEVAAIPNHIERHDRPELPDGALKDWLRLGVTSKDGSEQREDGRPYQEGGDAMVILHRRHVERLRDCLTNWLEREPSQPESGDLTPTQPAVREAA